MAQDNTRGTSGMAGMQKGDTGKTGMAGMDKQRKGKSPPSQVITAAQAKTSLPQDTGMSGEAMQQMPMLRPKRVWVASGSQDWDALRGFGRASGMIAMMNGMMVGGSPMQNMKMGKMDMSMTEMPAPSPEDAQKAVEATDTPASASKAQVVMTVAPDPPQIGDNRLTLTLKDTQGQPVPGLKLAASVAMISMDMGTATPPVTDLGGGCYQVKVNFSMAGPWRVTVDGGAGAVGLHETYKFEAGAQAAAGSAAEQGSSAQGPQTAQQATQAEPAKLPSSPSAPSGLVVVAAALLPNPPRVGSNTLTVTLTDSAGQPVTGATVTGAVAMTSMDMGTTHPAFKDMGGGKYQGKVGFSMAGPWRVTIKAAIPGGKAQSQAFNFTAK